MAICGYLSHTCCCLIQDISAWRRVKKIVPSFPGEITFHNPGIAHTVPVMFRQGSGLPGVRACRNRLLELCSSTGLTGLAPLAWPGLPGLAVLSHKWAELREQAAGKVWPVKDIGLSRSESGSHTGDLGMCEYYSVRGLRGG